MPYWDFPAKFQDGIRMLGKGFGSAAWRLKEDAFQKEFASLGAYNYLNDYTRQIQAVQRAHHRPALQGWQSFLRHYGLHHA
ncbi:MAG: hypothetical protein FGM40_06095, partial [Rhodocyclaceae bacterium]|nr:hypothetical protein [Rhodocyclaceae bacterium]